VRSIFHVIYKFIYDGPFSKKKSLIFLMCEGRLYLPIWTKICRSSVVSWVVSEVKHVDGHDPKVHYRVHKNPSLDHFLGCMIPVYPLTYYLSNMPLTLSSHLRIDISSDLFLSDLVTNNACISHVPYVLHALPFHSPWLNHPNIRWSVHVMKLLIMQSSPDFHCFLPPRSKYSPQHPAFKHP